MKVGHLNVLVVDDSLVIRAMVTGILEKERGINVTVAGTTAEADTVLISRKIDVMTLDINLPDCSGLDYIASPIRRGIPVIMMSGQTIEGSDVNGSALVKGATACFDKAEAMKRAPDLVALVKAAAVHRVHISPADAAAWNRMRTPVDIG